MNRVIILCLSLCAIYQCVAAGNGYVYKPPAKRTEAPLDNQSDFSIGEFITSQKEDIFESLSPKRPGANVKRCAKCTCGIPNSSRIVGGNTVKFNKYPWMVQLLMGKTRLFCGGALINNLYVLTAAHCVHNMAWNRMSARVLQFDRSTPATTGITRDVVGAFVHEQYNPTTIVNDIALLKLNKAIEMNDLIRPVCLPSPNQNFELMQGIVAGWGLKQEYGSVSQTLQEVTVPIITNSQCRRTQYKNMITENMICAGDVAKGGKDACQGDSGGPLVIGSGKFIVGGVVSYGFGCAKVNAPGVYTRVSKYVDWIYKKTGDSCYCGN